MKFPNAAKGIKKLFTAEILELISVVLLSVGTIMLLVAAGAAKTNHMTAAGVTGIGTLVLMTGAGVLGIIALIMQIIGYIQTAKDEDSFKVAIYITIIGIVMVAVASMFAGSNKTLSSASNMVSDLINIIVSVLTIMGIANLAAKLKNNDIVDKCTNIFKVIIAIGIISLIAKCVATFWPNQAGVTVAIVLIVISLVLSIVQYIMYIALLYKASNMLNE